MSFKNNYRVRKRESESMATLASARFFNSEKERKTIKLWRASQTLKRNHLKKFLSPTNSVQNGLRTETMESSTTGSASDSALFSESLRRLDSLSDKYALWSGLSATGSTTYVSAKGVSAVGDSAVGDSAASEAFDEHKIKKNENL
jgi:hypothetical protein